MYRSIQESRLSRVSILTVLVVAALLLASSSPAEDSPELFDLGEFHRSLQRGGSTDLPTWMEGQFTGSGVCATCHVPADGSDAMLNAQGLDISPPNSWRSTMKANSFRDPFFRARLESEVARHPQHQAAIEDKCLTCHAPMAREHLLAEGATAITLAQAEASELALDGVSCTLCHQISPENLGTEASYSGGYVLAKNRTIYGPYDDVLTWPMQVATSYTPQGSEHMRGSELCGTCHTLFTSTIDADTGEFGDEFPEQTPYLEWKNSVYAGAGPEARDCQDCHMPTIDEQILISNYPDAGTMTRKTPYWQHHFVGGNVTMLRILRDYADELGATARPEDFDKSIERTLAQLRERTAEFEFAVEAIEEYEVALSVTITNKTGHKLPTAYPTRRAWIHFVVEDATGATVFESGAWDADGEVIGLDADYEPHHDVITSGDQVQVYEAIAGNTRGEVTYGLLTASTYLKDNRIPPAGFNSTGPDYTHTAPQGAATTDLNFNRVVGTGEEGTGADIVRYEVDTTGATFPLTVTAQLVYSPMMKRALDDLFAFDTPRVNQFEGYWAAADKSPVVLSELTRLVVTDVDAGFMLR